MPLPVAHGLVGASIVIASRKGFLWREDWWPLLVGVVMAISPDFDLFFAWVLGYDIRIHGGFTHSILFAIPLGMFGALLAREFNRRGLVVYTAVALSHGLLDFLTKKDFGGAQLFWPFSTDRLRLGLFNYYEFYPAPGVDPFAEILRQALNVTYYEVMIFAPLFIAVLLWRQWQQRRAL
jgi:membrane-bound metal-dependent hydrolase YbcI (DUF457 family)